MRELLNSENILMSLLTKLGNLIILNFLFILGCVPIITAGASFTATWSVAMKMAEGEDRDIFKLYILSFKKNFFQATGIWFLFLFAAIVLAGDIYYGVHYMEGTMKGLIVGFAAFMSFLVILVFTFAFPIQARYNNKVLKHLWNAFLVAVGNIFWTLLIWLIWVIPVAVCYIYPEVFKYMGFFWFLCLFALIFLANSFIYLKIFKKMNS